MVLTLSEKTWKAKRLEMIERYEETETREVFVKEEEIWRSIEETKDPDPQEVREILAKAYTLAGLGPHETAVLINTTDPELLEEIYDMAWKVRRKVYGNRLVFFAPLYLSSECVNNCIYCGFRAANREMVRKTLSDEEIEEEVRALIRMGHKRLLLVYGEHPNSDVDYMVRSIARVYSIKEGPGEIRRVNVNAAPLTVEEFKEVHAVGIGTYQIFQETYHPETYRKVHPKGDLKHSYKWRLLALHRAQEAGIDDVAIGVLFGLYDWRFEVMATIYHALDMEREFGVGPHTVSFPRLEPAINTPFTYKSPYRIDDATLKKIIAIFRLAIPYTGLILTAREPAALRQELFKVGVSQTDAGSNISLGGYSRRERGLEMQQFLINDERTLDDFIYSAMQDGFIPSFCTACYRAGRTGDNFMPFAKTGLIQNFCTPNGYLTLKEYLLDYALEKTRQLGEQHIQEYFREAEAKKPKMAALVKDYMNRIQEEGERDLYL